MNERNRPDIPLARKKLYLETIPADEALARLESALAEAGWFDRRATETVSSYQSVGRYTASLVYANASSPHYPAAAMDGVAVRTVDLTAASDRNPVQLNLGEQAVIVDTGDPVPPGFDAVVMWEDLAQVTESSVTVLAAVAPWHHVRMVGEDVVKNECLFPSFYRLGPADAGALLAAGVLKLAVLKRPVTGFIPTGPELVAPGEAVQPGDIPEYNSAMLGAYASEWGAEPRTYPPVPDDPEQIRQAVEKALAECDIVCLLAGSSAGRDDYASTVIGSMGQVLAHGVATRPGKPVVVAVAGGKPVLGLPGYPVSAATAARIFLLPLIARKNGQSTPGPGTVQARFGRRMESPGGVDEYVQVRLGPVNDELVALPLSRGAGVVSALARADGFLVIPRGETGIEAGQKVNVSLYRPAAQVRRQILLAGSHDLTLDVIHDYLRRRYPPIALASAPLGSLGGLLALKRGEALLAGSHLLDPETGEYNVSYARRYLSGTPLFALSLVLRQQGLMVAKGNPLGITRLDDLARAGVRFINRQRGSGTRVLIDWIAGQQQVDTGAIQGYETEEYTHMAVAAAVASGAVDAGPGIFAAAQALDLDFVPVAVEKYELIVPAEHFENELVLALREVIGNPEFRSSVEALGGYSASSSGEVSWTIA